jgi:hypothetical protein
MKINSRFIIAAIFLAFFTLVFAGAVHAKKIRITKSEAAALITKFKAAYPHIAISGDLIESKSAGYDEKFHKNLVINIKRWEMLNERVQDASVSAEKREKASETSQKLVEKIAKVCADQAAQSSAAAKINQPVPQASGEAQPAAGITAVSTEAKAETVKVKKPLKKESEPEKYEPKTERGQKIKELLLGK